MEFLAQIAITVALFFSSLWSGALGLLHVSQSSPPVSKVSVTTTTTSDYGNVVSALSLPYISPPPGADLTTFGQIKVGSEYVHYAKDKNHVYINTGEILGDADSSTFQVFVVDMPGSPDEYAKDKNHVWFGYNLLLEADPSTFVVLSSPKSCGSACTYEAEDKNHKYNGEKIVQ